jgi:hypothetical protein
MISFTYQHTHYYLLPTADGKSLLALLVLLDDSTFILKIEQKYQILNYTNCRLGRINY